MYTTPGARVASRAAGTSALPPLPVTRTGVPAVIPSRAASSGWRWAAAAAERFRLDRVLLVPNACPPHKPERELTAYEHRVNMLRIALEGCPVGELCEVESRGTAPNYTIDTVRTLKSTYGDDTEIFLLVGSDEVPDFPSWKRPGEIAAEATVAVAHRAGWDLDVIPGLRLV